MSLVEREQERIGDALVALENECVDFKCTFTVCAGRAYPISHNWYHFILDSEQAEICRLLADCVNARSAVAFRAYCRGVLEIGGKREVMQALMRDVYCELASYLHPIDKLVDRKAFLSWLCNEVRPLVHSLHGWVTGYLFLYQSVSDNEGVDCPEDVVAEYTELARAQDCRLRARHVSVMHRKINRAVNWARDRSNETPYRFAYDKVTGLCTAAYVCDGKKMPVSLPVYREHDEWEEYATPFWLPVPAT